MAWLNEGLIGVEGGRALIQTPALVIDLDVLERNIARMGSHAKARGIGLRPHAKSHKCLEIAERQIAAGAMGICVAKLGEAEALSAGDEIASILVTSPVVTDAGIARLVALNENVKSLIAVCDDAEIAAQLNEAARATGKPLKILIDIDPGMGRTGIRPGDDAMALVEQIAQSNGLEYAGLQCYAGHVQHMESPN
jgi:3-hydroxy-D-aspartate aldolase